MSYGDFLSFEFLLKNQDRSLVLSRLCLELLLQILKLLLKFIDEILFCIPNALFDLYLWRRVYTVSDFLRNIFIVSAFM